MITIKCEDCPFIVGSTWCSLRNQRTFKTKMMCRGGLYLRITTGLKKIAAVYLANKKDPRIKKGEKQIEFLCKAYDELEPDGTEELKPEKEEDKVQSFDSLVKNQSEYSEQINDVENPF